MQRRYTRVAGAAPVQTGGHGALLSVRRPPNACGCSGSITRLRARAACCVCVLHLRAIHPNAQAGGNVVRLVGLYHAQRGAHTFFIKQARTQL
jgi:hypothetical protein